MATHVEFLACSACEALSGKQHVGRLECLSCKVMSSKQPKRLILWRGDGGEMFLQEGLPVPMSHPVEDPGTACSDSTTLK